MTTPRKPRAPKTATAAAPAPVPATATAAAPTPKKKTPRSTTSAPRTQKKNQESSNLDIDIAVQYVRQRVDDGGVNLDIENAIADISALTTAAAAGTPLGEPAPATRALAKRIFADTYHVWKKRQDEKAKADTEGKFVAGEMKEDSLTDMARYIPKGRFRFSKPSGAVLAAGIDFIIRELVTLGVNNLAAEDGKKPGSGATLQVKHLFGAGFADTFAYEHIHTLPAVRRYTAEAEDTTTGAGGAKFGPCIARVCDRVIAGRGYAVADDVGTLCANIVVQLIGRLASMIKLYSRAAGVKTVNSDVIRFAFEANCLHSSVDRAAFNKRFEECRAIAEAKKPEAAAADA